MAFKGLEDRFIAKASDIYNKYSTRDGGSGKGRNDLPTLEWKPNDPNATEQTRDTLFLPIGATKRDLSRMTNFMKSNDGLIFLGKQELQQSANAFAETRIINPLFVVANAVPFLHISRTLSSPSDFAVRGNQAHKSPASFDPKVGSAGRLQRDTANDALSSVTGKGGKNSLLSNLAPFQLLSTIRSVFSTVTGGSLGIDERPELDVGGRYFSIAMWQGFRKEYGSRGALESAKESLRSGDFSGAYANLKNVGTALIQESGLGSLVNKFHADGRGIPSIRAEGSRYFITSDVDADRYLIGSVNSAGDRPDIQLAYLDRQPYFLSTAPQPITATSLKSVSQSKADILKGVRLATGLFDGAGVATLVKNAGLQSLTNAAVNPLSLVTKTGPTAESHMQFNSLSLASRYDSNERIAYLRDHMKTQISDGIQLSKKNKMFITQNTFAKEGVINDINPRERSAGGYLSDPMNTPSNNRFKNIPKTNEDLVFIYITDTVNDKTVPFRALLTGLHETVNTETTDKRYIGRVERNIVYTGVQRELSFSLRVHAFSDVELEGVWQKINFMTGLCYPSTYDNGFMVPPFIKLTIGDVYTQQPGLLRSVNYTVDDNTSWEITEGRQAPHGIDMQVSFSIIDKKQYTGKNSEATGFYSIGSAK